MASTPCRGDISTENSGSADILPIAVNIVCNVKTGMWNLLAFLNLRQGNGIVVVRTADGDDHGDRNATALGHTLRPRPTAGGDSSTREKSY
jgi:hypothetical protein